MCHHDEFLVHQIQKTPSVHAKGFSLSRDHTKSKTTLLLTSDPYSTPLKHATTMRWTGTYYAPSRGVTELAVCACMPIPSNSVLQGRGRQMDQGCSGSKDSGRAASNLAGTLGKHASVLTLTPTLHAHSTHTHTALNLHAKLHAHAHAHANLTSLRTLVIN